METGVDGAQQPRSGVLPRGDQAYDQRQQHAGAQPPGIVASKAGSGPADPEPPDHCRHALLMPAPQRFRQPVAPPGGQTIFKSGQRMVAEIVVTLDPGARRLAGDFAKARPCPDQRRDQRGG